MRFLLSKKIYILGVTLISVLVVCNVGSASAQPSTDSDSESISVKAPTYDPEKDNQRDSSKSAQSSAVSVIDYWTQERIDRTIPADKGVFDASRDDRNTSEIPLDSIEKLEQVSKPVASKKRSQTVYNKNDVTNFSPVNGKVFFRNSTDGRDYICSGSAVNSDSKRLVITAGHCVHGGKGGSWHQNWVFIPNYHKGSRPNGIFVAKTFRTFNGWIDNGESRAGFERDVGFVTTYTNGDGQKVVNAVGGFGLQTGGSRSFDATVFGYPGNKNGGEVMWACWGETSTYYWFPSSYFPKITGCDFGGGASGGAWLVNYSNSTGLGSVRSVTSFGPRNSTDYNAGPYFDSAVTAMYRETSSD